MAGSDDSTPRFDHWGTAIADADPGTPATSPEGPRHGGRLSRATLLRLVLIALATVAAGAVVVHVAGGGTSPPAGARLTRASERAVAAAINLTAADLPGFSPQGASDDVSAGGNPGEKFKSCFGGGLPTDTSSPQFSSPSFDEHGGASYLSVGSQVSFVSAAELKRDAALAKNARFAQCFARAFAAMSFKAHGVTITGSNPRAQTLSTAPATASGVLPVLGMRASLTWTIRGIAFPFYFDLFLVGVGHDEVSLYSIALGRPYSSTAEKQLVSVLVARALAQPHQ
jgi:hypothetical protein